MMKSALLATLVASIVAATFGTFVAVLATCVVGHPLLPPFCTLCPDTMTLSSELNSVYVA